MKEMSSLHHTLGTGGEQVPALVWLLLPMDVHLVLAINQESRQKKVSHESVRLLKHRQQLKAGSQGF